MARKLKALAKTDDNLAATIRDSANQIWLAGLGAFAKAQAEGQKVFDTLVAEGQRLQDETKTAADERIAEIRSKGAGAWDKLEKVFEDRVGLRRPCRARAAQPQRADPQGYRHAVQARRRTHRGDQASGRWPQEGGRKIAIRPDR